jgi:AcrR family transcriptional regulator
MAATVTPIGQRWNTRKKLVEGLLKLLARQGFIGLSPQAVAQEAGVGVRHIYRLFGGMDDLLMELGASPQFWPASEELLQGYGGNPKDMTPAEQFAAFFKSLAACLRRRPDTLAVLAWENLHRSPYVGLLENARVRAALECFEQMRDDPPEGLDLTAVVAFLGAGAYQLAVWSKSGRLFGGLDLCDDADWGRLEGAVEAMVRGAFAAGCGS